MRWIEDQQESKTVESLSQKLNISIILSRFIVSTGIKTTEELKYFCPEITQKLENRSIKEFR